MGIGERPFQAFLDGMNIVTILLPHSYYNGQSAAFSLVCGQHSTPLSIREKIKLDRDYKYICQMTEEFLFDKTYWVKDDHGGRTELQIGAVIRTPEFDEKFYYDGTDLGVNCSKKRTGFKLWAPTAVQVFVKLLPPDGTAQETIEMKREEKGIWTVCIPRDLEYYRYSYLVCVNQRWQEAIDPYTVAVTLNGEMGVIVKLAKTKQPKPVLPPFEHPTDAIIYETHIRDFTIHPNSGIQHKGLYLGVGETGTRSSHGQLTGLSYLKNLGITHIEFLPFNDFAGVDERNPNLEYNWGYNPLHYNAPEGSYSTNPRDPYARIHELKKLIAQIHGQGLRVIMDVVYNHVFIREQSSFEKIVPGYYFRHDESGIPSNGTGVGNDLASERRMVRKFILDSLRYWIEEYHIDGFRFDLMGILDVTTMNEVKRMCRKMAAGILLLGEGWDLGTPLAPEEKANLLNQDKIPDIAQFNDWFRDSIKGSTFHLYDKGYAFGNEHYLTDAMEVMAGSIGLLEPCRKLFNEPFQAINYVESHDNHTMWDKLKKCFPDENESLLENYHRLATSIVILSQGIPFLHSGQEFFRTKSGVGNSYRSPDAINQLDWDRCWIYSENVEYLKGIIEIRKAFSCFRLRTAEDIRKKMQPLMIAPPIAGYIYQNDHHTFPKILLLINPGLKREKIVPPEGRWFVLADGKRSSSTPFQELTSAEIELEPVSLNAFAGK